MRLISPRADYTIKYRYYRIRQKADGWVASSVYGISLYELRFYTQADQSGTEFALTGTAIALDYYNTYIPANMNNNNLSDRWWSLYTTSTYKWFGIDSGASAKCPLRSFAAYPYATASGSQFPKYAGIEGSDDGTNWYCIGLIASSNITTSQWQYYNINRAAWIEYVSGTLDYPPAPPRYLEFVPYFAAVYAVNCNAAGRKVYFEFGISNLYSPSWTININGVDITGSYFSGKYSMAIDFEARKLWYAINANVDVSSGGYQTNATEKITISYPSIAHPIGFSANFGHYPDTPFTYAVPAGFERIQV